MSDIAEAQDTELFYDVYERILPIIERAEMFKQSNAAMEARERDGQK